MSKSREKLFILSTIALITTIVAFAAYLWYLRYNNKNSEPIITCASEEIYVSVNATKEDLLTGVTAMDAEDGDLTDSVVIGSISSFAQHGKCEITYVVFDSNGTVSTAKRTLHYTDYHSPHFIVSDDFIYQTGETVNPIANVRAYDCIDGDISNRILMNWIDGDNAEKKVEFRVSNSMGDVSSFTVNLITKEKESQNTPVIKLDEYLVYLHKGESLDPLSLIKSITIGKNSYTLKEYGADNAYCDDRKLDTSEKGTYKVGIYCKNGEQYIGETELFVTVED